MRAVIYSLILGLAITASLRQVVGDEKLTEAVQDAIGQGLFLTPLIRKGLLEEARNASEDNMEISKIKSNKPVKSYSGYLTINDTTQANLFFWFFPAQKNPDVAPVILSVNEYPGHSALKGVFLEQGPFYINEKYELIEREFSWTKTHSMLYIDAPAGSGFSFSLSLEGLATNSEEEASEIYSTLIQFFTLFQDFQQRDFYLVGKSYAGSFIPHIVKKIDTENKNSPLKINLKGAIIGSPWTDSLQQYHYSNYMYKLGLIGDNQLKTLLDTESQLQEEIEKGNIYKAFQLAQALSGSQSYMLNFTGFDYLSSALISHEPEEFHRYLDFLESGEVQKYLHVGLHEFVGYDSLAIGRFGSDFLQSHVPFLEEMLDKGYRTLIYAPQFDLFSTFTAINTMVNDLKWKGAEEFQKAPRKIWRVNDDVAGYVRTSSALTFVLLRNAGNDAIMDQPAWVYDLVERFLYQKEF